MKNNRRFFLLAGWVLFHFMFLVTCATDDLIPDDEDEFENEIEEVIVTSIRDLKVINTARLYELQVTWTFPPEAVSVEISYRLEDDSEENAARNNIRVSSDDKGVFQIKVSEYGEYIITAVAIDDYGKRSQSVSVIVSLSHENHMLTNFPEGADPKEIGIRLAERFIRTVDTQSPRANYPYVCTWLGVFWFSQAIGNDMLYNRLLARYDKIFFSSGSSSLLPSPNHVDNNVFGSVPLEIYKKYKQNKYLELGLMYADTQWNLPTNATESQKNWHNQGYSWQTRVWIDDMFMITAVQTQAYLVTGDRKYIDRTAEEMAMYLDRIQRPNGLFYHTPNVPFFWGRGNGWMAVGMTELLKALPNDNPHRTRIEESYRLMMSTLLQFQADDGMWRQLIDDTPSWKETSCTAMFAYAMIMGVKNGWLDEKTYGTAARQAWITLLTYLNYDDNITDVCIGTNASNSYQYYIDRNKVTGDLHGQAPLIWCASALCSDMGE